MKCMNKQNVRRDPLGNVLQARRLMRDVGRAFCSCIGERSLRPAYLWSLVASFLNDVSTNKRSWMNILDKHLGWAKTSGIFYRLSQTLTHKCLG